MFSMNPAARRTKELFLVMISGGITHHRIAARNRQAELIMTCETLAVCKALPEVRLERAGGDGVKRNRHQQRNNPFDLAHRP
jgi:hypothetical protein